MPSKQVESVVENQIATAPDVYLATALTQLARAYLPKAHLQAAVANQLALALNVHKAGASTRHAILMQSILASAAANLAVNAPAAYLGIVLTKDARSAAAAASQTVLAQPVLQESALTQSACNSSRLKGQLLMAALFV